MSPPPVIDPLEAADQLVAEIAGADKRPADIVRLIRALDTLSFAMHFIDADVPSIAAPDPGAPQVDYDATYEKIRQRYSRLGFYWLALHSNIKGGGEGELAVGDAIDDLADIFCELSQLQGFRDHADRENALADLRVRHESHLWMHLYSLRQYLEEVKRDD